MRKMCKKSLLAVFFCTAIILGVILYMEKTSSSDEFNTSLAIFTSISTVFLAFIMAVITYEIGSHQEKVQRDAIKMQLFDRRYKIFETIENSHTVITTNDYSNFVLSGYCNDPFSINKKIYDIKEQLRDAAMLSQALFDEKLTRKIKEASDRYEKLYNFYFTLFKTYNSLVYDEKYLEKVENSLLTVTEKENQQCDKELKKEFPNFYNSNELFKLQTAQYSDWLAESGILIDFDKYLKINDLDKF